jgi:hypothetical protein
VGKRGKGKTTLAKSLILQQNENSQVYILDFLGEYHDLRRKNLFIFRENLYFFCQSVWENSGKRKETLAVFDEIDLYGKNNPYISFLYRFGRHKNIEIIAVARRFYDLPVIVRALTDEFYLFQITEERDLNYLRRSVPENVILEIMKLEDFHYFKISF